MPTSLVRFEIQELQTDVSNCCRSIIISDDFCFNILSKFCREDFEIFPKKEQSMRISTYISILLMYNQYELKIV